MRFDSYGLGEEVTALNQGDAEVYLATASSWKGGNTRTPRFLYYFPVGTAKWI